MKKLLGFLVAGFLLTGTAVLADDVKGQKLYSKKLKKACGITGAKVAAKHTQSEWKAIQDAKGLEAEIKKICPNVKAVKAKYIEHLFDFFHKYASDSGNVPSC